jgi:predicted dehydrogenase
MPDIRYDFIRLGVENGVRLIAFEKPIAESMTEAIRIKDLLEESETKVVVSHQHRYGVHYQKVKEIIDSGALGRIHTVYGTSTGWMMHMMTHLIDYMSWFLDYPGIEWVMGQACGKGKFKDKHPSPDYIGGFIQYSNGIRGIVESGAGAPDVPEVDYWWRKCRIGAQGTEGFAEVLTGGGWRAVTRDGIASGDGCMNYDLDMPPYIRDMATWLSDDTKPHPCRFANAYKGFEALMGICRSAVEGGQVALPLDPGMPEISELEKSMSEKIVVPTTPENAKEYLGS